MRLLHRILLLLDAIATFAVSITCWLRTTACNITIRIVEWGAARPPAELERGRPEQIKRLATRKGEGYQRRPLILSTGIFT